jgi:membrane protein YdbS with pleckstrin-like domain
MDAKELLVKQSPFVFLKHIAIAEFVLAVLPLFLAAMFNLGGLVESSGIHSVSYDLLVALFQVLVQMLIVGVTFYLWQVPYYLIEGKAITYKRGTWFEAQTLAAFADIKHVNVRQGWLGKRLDYGTVVIATGGASKPAEMRNVPNPHQYAAQIMERVAAQPAPLLLEAKPVPELIADGEGQFLEFKASLMWDYRRQSVNKELYEPVMKNLAGFMNTAGGKLLIGVSDEGEVLGLERDMSALKKPNPDGYENVFNVAFANMIGVENRQYVAVSFPQFEDKIICALDVQPARHPVFMTYQGKEEFYIRAGNACQALTVSKATQYIDGRFGDGNGAG